LVFFLLRTLKYSFLNSRFTFSLAPALSVYFPLSVRTAPSLPPTPFQVTVQPRCCRQAGRWTCTHRVVCQHAAEQPRTVSAGLAPLGNPAKGHWSARCPHCFLLAASWSSSLWPLT